MTLVGCVKALLPPSTRYILGLFRENNNRGNDQTQNVITTNETTLEPVLFN